MTVVLTSKQNTTFENCNYAQQQQQQPEEPFFIEIVPAIQPESRLACEIERKQCNNGGAEAAMPLARKPISIGGSTMVNLLTRSAI